MAQLVSRCTESHRAEVCGPLVGSLRVGCPSYVQLAGQLELLGRVGG